MSSSAVASESGGLFSNAWFDRLTLRMHADGEIGHVGRWSSFRLGFFSDSQGGTVAIREGRVAEVAAGHLDDAAKDAVLLDGSERAWRIFLQPVPPSLYNDILAMDRRQDDFAIRGERGVLIRNLRLIELIMTQCRELGAEPL